VQTGPLSPATIAMVCLRQSSTFDLSSRMSRISLECGSGQTAFSAIPRSGRASLDGWFRCSVAPPRNRRNSPKLILHAGLGSRMAPLEAGTKPELGLM